MRKFLLIFSISIFVVLSSCSKGDQQKNEVLADGTVKAEVVEVLQANSYTYLKVKQGSVQHWLAVTRREMKTGTTVYYKPELEMNNFESKDLKRTFDSIYFVNTLSDKPLAAGNSTPAPSMNQRQKENVKQDIEVEQPEGGLSISKLSANRAVYEGKIVTVRGQVTKYNQSIMGKNWLHIQDGTEDANTFDLTVTTNDEVKVGDTVTCKGKIVLNKDFGAGYKYDIIMEEASVR